MAEGRHLYIHLDELSGESAMAGGSSKSADKQDKGAQDVQNAAKKLVSYAAVKSTATRVISGSISQVELKTGAAEYQQRLQAGFSIAQQIWNAGETIAIGALAGGPIGAIAGVVFSGIQTAITISQKQNELRLQRNLENISIDMQNIRAGTAGRRGNNQ